MKDSTELARLVSLDLGTEVTPWEIRSFLLSGVYPERLTNEERNDMMATLYKELSNL